MSTILIRILSSVVSRLARLSLVPIVLASGAQLAVATDIYRCQDGETTVFADRPCDERGELHASSGAISVVEAPDDLARIAERNAEFLAAETDRRADRARARAAARRAEAEAARRMAPMVRTVPVYPVGADAFGGRPASRSSNVSGNNRLEALRSGGGNRDTDQGRRIPIPATSGRQLGSRRDDEDG